MPINRGYRKIIVTAKGVNLNAVADTRILAPFPRYAVRTYTVTNASTSLGASAATIGLYTAAAAGGTALSASAVATALTAATKLQDRTLATTDIQTSANLYVNVGIVHGSAATCDAIVEFQEIL